VNKDSQKSGCQKKNRYIFIILFHQTVVAKKTQTHTYTYTLTHTNIQIYTYTHK